MNDLTFEQIFNETGMYVADSFQEGFCFFVDEYGTLKYKLYEDKDEIIPKYGNVVTYKGLFSKTYKKAFTRQSLFKKLEK